MKKIDKESLQIIYFLKNSNNIENVFSDSALIDSINAFNYLLNQDKLTIENIERTHYILTYNLLHPDYVGKIRKIDVRVGSEICPKSYLVRPLLEKYIEKQSEVRTIKQIFENHVKFENIHPFADGNGRIGRMIVNWFCHKLDLPIVSFKYEDITDYYRLFDKELNLDKWLEEYFCDHGPFPGKYAGSSCAEGVICHKCGKVIKS
jgi:hypothetical protein